MDEWEKIGELTYRVTRETKERKLGWLWNDDEPDPPDWYAQQTGATGKYLRWLWWWRNPCHNLTHYVWGVQDQSYVITGTREPVLEGPAPGGWKCHIIWTRLPRPYVSYQGKHLVLYLGWRYGGALGAKINWKSNLQG
jgi:hypothetical protein